MFFLILLLSFPLCNAEDNSTVTQPTKQNCAIRKCGDSVEKICCPIGQKAVCGCTKNGQVNCTCVPAIKNNCASIMCLGVKKNICCPIGKQAGCECPSSKHQGWCSCH